MIAGVQSGLSPWIVGFVILCLTYVVADCQASKVHSGINNRKPTPHLCDPSFIIPSSEVTLFFQ